MLDVGCGTGALLRLLAERLPPGVDLRGIDPAPAMIDVARTRLGERENIGPEVAAAERLPFGDRRFDLVVSTVSFHHWADQAAGLREVGRTLRPGGRLVLVDRFAVGWLRLVDLLARRNMRTTREVERLLEGARLRLLGWSGVFDLGPLPLIQAATAEAASTPMRSGPCGGQ